MFQRMFQGSQAVLLRPSVATFEEYERDDLRGALLYVLCGGLIVGILSAATSAARHQVDVNLAAVILVMAIAVPVGFLIYSGAVQMIGRVLGGGGTNGRIAYDIALFWAPMLVLGRLTTLAIAGPLAALGGVVSVALWAFCFYLSYLGVQSAMGLSRGRALATVAAVLAPVLLLNLYVMAIGA